MSKIRDLFHDVGNFHNKISVGAGIAKIALKQDFKDKTIPPEIKRVLTRLSELERSAIEASVILHKLRDAVYLAIDPESGRQKSKGGEPND